MAFLTKTFITFNLIVAATVSADANQAELKKINEKLVKLDEEKKNCYGTCLKTAEEKKAAIKDCQAEIADFIKKDVQKPCEEKCAKEYRGKKAELLKLLKELRQKNLSKWESFKESATDFIREAGEQVGLLD